VIGSSCAGKTTLASAIARIRGCPHIELDAIHWKPDWVEAPLEEMRERTQEAVSAESWALDGNYSRVRDLVWARATDVIWLNYDFPLVMSRALRRTVRRIATREELYSGNRESLRMALLDRESILWWVIRTHGRRRRDYRELCTRENFPHIAFTELRHPREADALVAALEASSGATPAPAPPSAPGGAG